jgi:hypothetical protein
MITSEGEVMFANLTNRENIKIVKYIEKNYGFQ